MFDIGFSEVLVIFVLALIVLGPEKLPKVAAQVGRWIGRARGMARQFREQLEEEVNLEEARKAQAARNPPAPEPAATESSPRADVVSPISTASDPSPTSTPAPTPTAQTEPEQPVYPDSYSHAHATDSLGRPIPDPTNASPTGESDAQQSTIAQTGHNQSPITESGQHDWVGGVAGTEKQPHAPGAYASSHERGT
jgi:sec-independent protein translocase protein TatB